MLEVGDRMPGGGESSQALSRRQAVGLMLAGALALAALPLGGCTTRRERRIMLAEDLLREKYGRDFSVVFEAYGFDTATKPTAYCCAVGEEDLVFRLEFDAVEGSIVRDSYVGRKLGRQVEAVITDCFAGQGIDIASHVVVYTRTYGAGSIKDEDPDITLDDYLLLYEQFSMGASIFLKDTEVDPRKSIEFRFAIIDMYERLKDTLSPISVYIIRSENLEEYREYLLQHPDFYGGIGSIEHRPIDGFWVSVRDLDLVIIEDNFWK